MPSWVFFFFGPPDLSMPLTLRNQCDGYHDSEHRETHCESTDQTEVCEQRHRWEIGQRLPPMFVHRTKG